MTRIGKAVLRVTESLLIVAASWFFLIVACEYSRFVQQWKLGDVPGLTANSMVKMDALSYRRICTSGYYYQYDRRSNVAYFPSYPSLCDLLQTATSYDADVCMLIVANFFFVLFVVVLCLIENNHNNRWLIAVVCLFPSTFFLRVPYAESMLCFFISLTLLGMQRRWPVWLLAVFAGLASGTRPVGIAVSASVWWYAVFSKNQPLQSHLSLRSRVVSLLWVVPLSCFGLLGYMTYLWWAFDAPLAFAQTQEHWTFMAPKGYSAWDKVCSLITLEPIWDVYNPASQRYWMGGDARESLLFNLLFWNPIFYLFAWFLIALGWWKKWLKDYEIVLSVGLLLIPYVTRAYEMSMASHARFAAVVIPQYFVLGRLFAMMPPAIAGCLCGLMGLMLGLWTALFVGGYRFF